MCHVTHNKSSGLGLTVVIEVRKCVVYILVDINIFLIPWFYGILLEIFHMLGNPHILKIPYSGKFPYPVFLQGYIQNLIPGLPYPGNFPNLGKFPYPVKASIHKSAYFSESNNNLEHKLSGLNDSLYAPPPFLT